MAQARSEARAPQRAHPLPPRERRPSLQLLERRGRRGRPRRLAAVSAAAVAVGSLLAVTGAHAYLTQGQARLSRLQDQLSSQLTKNRDLELRVAQLEQPSNVMSEAQKQGLVTPSSVTDLPQANPAPPAGSASTSTQGSQTTGSSGSTGSAARSAGGGR
ncbi:MAG TPA: hypothetical protein VMR97_15205 [Acidimicrobiales bacterium]|nr:hypothetical protein [Acidimicrobiales bacterium]